MKRRESIRRSSPAIPVTLLVYQKGPTVAKAASGATRADDDTLANTVGESLNDLFYTEADMRAIHSFEDALKLVTDTVGDILDATDEIGSGFAQLDNKDRLVDTTFIILSFSINDGDFRDAEGFQQKFVSLRVVAQTGEKYWFTDGSTGISRQLRDYVEMGGRKAGLLVKNGLRKSEYTFTDANGNEQPAKTYYLNV